MVSDLILLSIIGFGIFLVVYGLFHAIAMKIPVGFRGLMTFELHGNKARLLALGYTVGGLLVASSGCLAWLNIASFRDRLVNGIGLVLALRQEAQ